MTEGTGGSSEGVVRSHPVAELVLRRTIVGCLTLIVVSALIFGATQVLPGNAATALLGRNATPAKVKALTNELRLDEAVPVQYARWFGSALTGDLGTSFTTRSSVVDDLRRRAANSFWLVLFATVGGSLLGCSLGLLCAVNAGRRVDRWLPPAFLAITAIPEFVVAVGLVMLLASLVFHILPAVSFVPPGESVFSNPEMLVLPTLTLIIVITPYVFRITRAAVTEALCSDYVEMAELKGLSSRRVLFWHALPNSVAPIAQVVGLNLLYLAGGIVAVEYVFNYPGLGQGLDMAVSNRDIPTIQAIVLLLAVFYIVVNIATDAVALAASPRRRLGA